MVPLLEPSMCLLLSLLVLIFMSQKGPFQQERKCIRGHNGKRGCEFSSGNRGSCSATVVLQYHTKRGNVHLPPLLKPASWLRYWGLDEAYVYQLNLMGVCQTCYWLSAVLLYPSKMLYPGVLPLVSMFDAFYREGSTRHSEGNKKRLKLFYVAFFA
jgi:hypothetical protein